ncbi:DMT family transporter [Carnimonas bestiolae]|uniref:DMT family transporter n=1 Tax=Carnimonas bestiolae TaxID=3402172 RepID=UPI003EDBFF60
MNVLPAVFVVMAALMDVIANLCVAKSRGFSRLGWGLASILLIWAAFFTLGFAVKSIDVSIAYASWGAIGVLGTALLGRIVFKQKISARSMIGIVMVIAAVGLLSFSE